jgi:hypothetical protein
LTRSSISSGAMAATSDMPRRFISLMSASSKMAPGGRTVSARCGIVMGAFP